LGGTAPTGGNLGGKRRVCPQELLGIRKKGLCGFKGDMGKTRIEGTIKKRMLQKRGERGATGGRRRKRNVKAEGKNAKQRRPSGEALGSGYRGKKRGTRRSKKKKGSRASTKRRIRELFIEENRKESRQFLKGYRLAGILLIRLLGKDEQKKGNVRKTKGKNRNCFIRDNVEIVGRTSGGVGIFTSRKHWNEFRGGEGFGGGGFLRGGLKQKNRENVQEHLQGKGVRKRGGGCSWGEGGRGTVTLSTQKEGGIIIPFKEVSQGKETRGRRPWRGKSFKKRIFSV